MIKNYRMTIQYDGSRYQGWQRQDSTNNTIQGKIEAVLSKMVDRPVEIVGAGRTDSGVHALSQVANVHLKSDMSTKEIMEYINQYLPDDIAITSMKEVPDRFHSRLNAKGKTYEYKIVNSSVSNVFLRKYSYMVPEKLNVEKMQEAAALFCGTHDFKAFTSNKRSKKSTVRTIENITITREKEVLTFTFSGNGFLYHMIRILMGTLLEVGIGKRNIETIPVLLQNGSREDAGPLVPGLGLTLVSVKY